MRMTIFAAALFAGIAACAAPRFTIVDGVLTDVELNGATSVTIPDSVTGIGDGAFAYCSGLTSVVIPDSVTSIDTSAFYGCSSLVAFKVAAGNPAYKSVKGLLLSKDGTTLILGVNGDVAIPDSVTSIGDWAFEDRSGLTSIVIPGSVTSIGDGAFAGCNGLTSIKIPDSVTSIGPSVFFDCSGLTSIVIPASVTSINFEMFVNCSGLTSIVIPASVTSIGENAFDGCSSLVAFKVASGNPAYKSVKGLLLSKDGTTLILGVNGDVAIPDSVTSIGDDAFYGCSGLTSIVIPDSVTRIGDGAFYGCSGLTSIVIPDSVTSIDYYAFGDCSGLTSIVIPDSVTSIGNWAFRDCSGLTSVTMEGDAPGVEENAFDGVAEGFVVRIPRTAKGYDVVDGKWQGMKVEYYDLAPTPTPTPTPIPTPAPTAGMALFDAVEGAVAADAASVYDGFLRDASGTIAGTVQVKVSKCDKRTGLSTVAATMQPAGGKKATLKAADNGKAAIAADGPTAVSFAGGKVCELVLGADAMYGTYGEYSFEGARNAFSSKSKDEKAAMAAAIAPWLGAVNAKFDGGTAAVSVQKTGKARATVTLASGAKETVAAQVLAGDGVYCIPVVAQKKAKKSFALWLQADGTVAVEGLGDGVVAAKAVAPPAELVFAISGGAEAWTAAGLPGETALLPDGFSFSGGVKWKLPKADTVKLVDGVPSIVNANGIPSGLKLTYKASDGTFKGTFKAYCVEKGRLKSKTVNISGIMVGEEGFGTAEIKKTGSIEISIARPQQ